MKTKQKLGPWQDAWVRSLESGVNNQGKSRLARKNADGEWQLCCLGVACEVMLTNGEPLATYVLADGTAQYGDGWDAVLPDEAVELFKFFGKEGDIKTDRCQSDEEQAAVEKEVGLYAACLYSLNDSGNWSFPQIAAFVRKYPHLIFSEPA